MNPQEQPDHCPICMDDFYSKEIKNGIIKEKGSVTRMSGVKSGWDSEDLCDHDFCIDCLQRLLNEWSIEWGKQTCPCCLRLTEKPVIPCPICRINIHPWLYNNEKLFEAHHYSEDEDDESDCDEDSYESEEDSYESDEDEEPEEEHIEQE